MIRNDFTIEWNASPRIIIVDAPSTECTMQDLLDTLRDEESKTANIDDVSIVSASGKEPLGGGTKVGLTVALQNAVIGFEARPGPDWINCFLNGGNLVAFDTDRITAINPTHPTAFISISKTASSSATLQEQDALNYSSYQNSVWIDVNSSNIGIEYPTGNREYPVNNVPEAITIATNKGFKIVQLLSDVTLTTGDNLNGFTIQGENSTLTHLTIEDGSLTEKCEIRDCSVTGILDGDTTIYDCTIEILNYVNGQIHHSMINNLITLGGGSVANIHGCFSGVPGTSTPTIDMGGSGQSLALRAYDGGIKLINKSGSDPVSIDMSSGQIKLDSTITNGTIICRGVGRITEDFSTGSTEVINQLLNEDNISNAIWEQDGLTDATFGSMKELIQYINKITNNKVTKTGDLITIYDYDGISVWKTYDLSNGGRVEQ